MSGNRGLFGANRSRRTPETAIDPKEVARVAYGLYEERGREEGHALDDWLRAEAILRQQNQRGGRILV